MNKRILLLLSAFCLLFLLGACDGTTGDSIEPTAPADVVTAEPGEGRATPTTPPLPEATERPDDYPPPLEPTPPPAGYETESAEPNNPYPAPESALPEEGEIDIDFAALDDDDATVWIALSTGIQCEPESKLYADINEAADALMAEDVVVYDAEIESRIVCAACGCPESTYYRLQINEDGLETAVLLGFAEDDLQ